MLKKAGWISAAVLMAAVVGGVAATAIEGTVTVGALEYEAAASLPVPTRQFTALSAPVSNPAQISAKLDAAAQDPRLGQLNGVVTDAATGQVVWSHEADRPASPASATKILTAAAALYTLDPAERITTEVVRGAAPGTVVIKAAGDVMLTNEQMDDLAAQIGTADTVLVDASIWSEKSFLDSWAPEDIAGGYIAPVEPAMLYGGRLGETEGDVPRSTTPALDVAGALAQRLSATAGAGTAPVGAEVIARTQSAPLWQRMEVMMEDSDNVLAEAIGREVAVKRGAGNDSAAAVRATKEVLAENGFDLTGLDLKDNSGLSEGNRNTPRLLGDVLTRATQDAQLRPLLNTLPIAAANGTLANRYHELDGRGWVRAKTGTLTGTSALAGIVTSREGQTYTFALLSNDSEILAAREGLDTFVSTLR